MYCTNKPPLSSSLLPLLNHSNTTEFVNHTSATPPPSLFNIATLNVYFFIGPNKQLQVATDHIFLSTLFFKLRLCFLSNHNFVVYELCIQISWYYNQTSASCRRVQFNHMFSLCPYKISKLESSVRRKMLTQGLQYCSLISNILERHLLFFFNSLSKFIYNLSGNLEQTAASNDCNRFAFNRADLF